MRYGEVQWCAVGHVEVVYTAVVVPLAENDLPVTVPPAYRTVRSPKLRDEAITVSQQNPDNTLYLCETKQLATEENRLHNGTAAA